MLGREWHRDDGAALRIGGCLSLFGDTPERHRLFAEHLTAEYRVTTEGRGRTVDEWKLRPEHSDNHWFACRVESAVAASMQGCQLPELASMARWDQLSFAVAVPVARGDWKSS